jgi:hypothetical protein
MSFFAHIFLSAVGSGLEMHMQNIRFFQCRMMGIAGGNCDPVLPGDMSA